MDMDNSRAHSLLMICACLLMGGIWVALVGCGPSMQTLDSLASSGRIDPVAPVMAEVHIDIAAPPARVWALLVNAPAWSKWDKDIASISTTQPLAAGQQFTWNTGSTTIHSQVQLFEPERRLGWTGAAYTAKAVHVWTLTREPDGFTRVAIDESMDGPLMATLFSSTKLVEADQAWLAALKKAAEQ